MDIGLGSRKDFIHPGNLKPSKVFNMLKKMVSGPKPVLDYFPLTYYIDVSTLCNLKCTYCFHSDYDRDQHIKRQFMKYEEFLTVLDKIKDYALMLHLYTWGESLLNPDIFRMIRSALDQGIRSRISSNIAMPMSDEFIENLIGSGLHRLTCSIDGPTQETYGKYRVGGDLERVLDNARRMLAARKRHGVKYPLITYRMIVFEWNHAYVEEARELARKIGFDAFYIYPGNFSKDGKEVVWDIKNKTWKNVLGRNSDLTKALKPCHWLLNSVAVTATGSSMSCCTNADLAAAGPSLIKHSLSDIWNNEGYINSRKFTLGLSQDRSSVMHQCQKCPAL